MSLTRDEIREACETVKWTRRQTGKGGIGWFDGGTGKFGRTRFTAARMRSNDRSNADALALLEATGEECEIRSSRWGWRVRRDGESYSPEPELSLRTVAVRAVNRWAETKKETP